MQVLSGTHRTKRVAALSARAAAIAIVCAAAALGARGTIAAQATDPPESFTADVSISQSHVAADGQPLPGAAPAITYRVEQRATATGVAATVAVLDIARESAEGVAGLVAIDNPFLAVRMESDPDGGLRLYNKRGQLIRNPAAADRRLFVSADATPRPRIPGRPRPDGPAARVLSRGAGLLLTASGSADRRAALERRFGPSRERVRGLDRYVSARQDDLDEMLVDPATALPTELNAIRGGTLAVRVQMAYAPQGDGLLIRRWCRAERLMADAGRRVVTTIDVTNVRVTGGVR